MKIVPFKKTQMKRDKEKLINQKFCRLVFDTIFALFLHLIFPSNAIAYFTQVISYHEYLNELFTLHKKRSFPLRISPVNVTTCTVPCGFGHIYWRNP